MDIEIAHRSLAAICSMTILEWHDGQVVSGFSSYFNPECDVEEFFQTRHGLTYDMLEFKPYLCEKWIQIYDILENKMVFMHSANDRIALLNRRADVDRLNMPNFKYGDTKSIARRTWPGMADYPLPALVENLGLGNKHYNSYEDAKNVGLIVLKAAELYDADTPEELFDKMGYAGGCMRNKEKISYRSKKDKKNNIYIANDLEKNKTSNTQNTK